VLASVVAVSIYLASVASRALAARLVPGGTARFSPPR
jgi:hypothetical protein